MNICIFDLDGTLLNTIEDLGQACNFALQQYGLPIHEITDYPRLVGNGINKLIERSLPEDIKAGEDIPKWVMRLKSKFIPFYNAHNCDWTRPYEGIENTLAYLRQNGWHLAVASNKYQIAAEKIVRHFFADTFEIVVGENENIPRKPNPQMVIHILSQLKADATSQTFVIGDSIVDIQTAHHAGLPVIACTWGFGKEEDLKKEAPDYIVHTPQEIIRFIS